MTVDQMRASISSVYSNWKWREKVERMHDNQVIAIYKNMERSGKLYSRGNKKKEKEPEYRQMTIFDY